MKKNPFDRFLWSRINEDVCLATPIFKLVKAHRKNNRGQQADFYYMDCPSWVTIIPYNRKDDQFTLIRQFRHGSSSVSIEFPAGLVDEGESPLDTAKRELLEETGMKSEKMVFIGQTNPNPALFNNLTYTFVAENPEEIAGQNLDQHEEIEIFSQSRKQLEESINIGSIDSAIMIQAYFWFLSYEKGV